MPLLSLAVDAQITKTNGIAESNARRLAKCVANFDPAHLLVRDDMHVR
jgi:hypothetical protein